MWNHRLFLRHGDAKYVDVLERILYNNGISGISLDGKTFFYPNTLSSSGTGRRPARSAHNLISCKGLRDPSSA